jgi:hypothetical protein
MAKFDSLPLVEGLTLTARDTEPFLVRLADFLSAQRGNAQENINEGLQSLEQAFQMEQNERMKARLAAAITLIREGPST